MAQRLGTLVVAGLLLAVGMWASLGRDQAEHRDAEHARSASTADEAALRSEPVTAPANAPHDRTEAERPAPAAAAEDDPDPHHGNPDWRARAKLAALDARGLPLASYRVQLRRMASGPKGCGVRVPDFAVDVTPEDCAAEHGKTWATLRGLPAGSFRFEVSEGDHANTLTPPVALAEGAAIPEIVVRLTRGAVLTGKVIDEHGKPISGAVVRTAASEAIGATGEAAVVARELHPSFFSQAQASTDAKGRFRLSKLAFADYMIRIGHPEYCPGLVRGLTVSRRDRSADAGAVRLVRGAIVEGTTREAGRPSGRIRISVSAQPEPAAAGQRGALPNEDRRTPWTSAISDGRGHFRLIQRLPPGTFTARATRPGPSSGSPSTFSTPSGSELTFTVAPDQQRVFLNLDLPAR